MGTIVGRDRELADLLRRLRQIGAAVLTGEAGVGKTVLLREAARRCRGYGWRLVEVHPSEATRNLPLWPLHPLIPTAATGDRAQLTEAVRQSLAVEDDRRTLLVVDDAQHLDADSIAVLSDLAADPSWTVVATVRDGSSHEETLDSLWSSDPAAELSIDPLDRHGTVDLASTVLDGPTSPSLLEWLVGTSRGNPLLIRELLLDALDQEMVELDDDGWRLTTPSDPTPVGPRTRRCIQRRIGRVDDDARRLLDLMTVAGYLRVERIPADLAPSLATLEDRRLLVQHVDIAEEAWVTVDHPLVGEVVLDTMDTGRRWAATSSLLELVSRAVPKPGDASRLATWATAIGQPLETDRWVLAAREAIARFDLDHALTWAQAAVAGDHQHHGAHRSLGEVLRLRGDLPAAAAALANAAATAVTEDDIAATALDRAALMGWQRGEPAEAMAILRAAVDQIEDPVRAMSLRSEAAVFGSLLGRFDDVALVASVDPEARSMADAPSRWTLGLNELYALTMLGRVDGADELAATLLADDPAVIGERPQEVDLLLSMRGAARIQRGEVRQGIAELVEALEPRREREQFRGIATAVLALLLDLAEDPRAAAVAAESVDQHAWMDPFGSSPIAAAVAALVASNEGRPGEATDHLATFDEDLDGADPWTAIWIGRARARVAFDDGNAEQAVARCRRAGEVALATEHRAYATITLHDAVNYGGAADIVEPLVDAVDATSGGSLLELLAQHAVAVAGGDADGVDSCSQRFMRLGVSGLAAEAQSQRAQILVAEGDLVAARRADFTGRTASVRGVTTPGSPPVPDAVSDRELEIARLAAQGGTSARIAATTYLSTRTVDNHLHAVYRKLGVRGRDELSSLLL